MSTDPSGGQSPYGQSPYGQGAYGQAPYAPGHDRPQQPQGWGASPDERTWGMLAHLLALAAAFLTGFLGFLPPLLVLASDRGRRSPFVRGHALASLNFQITVLIVAVVGTLLAVVGTVLTLGLGLVLIVPVALAYAVFVLVVQVLAAVKANNGEEYRYPLTLSLVR